MFRMKINDRAFNAIKAGTKTVEIRANKPNSDIPKMVIGNTIKFTSNIGEITCEIIKITHYSSVRELLTHEKPENCLSSGGNIEQGITSVESIPGYKQIISENGVYAINIVK